MGVDVLDAIDSALADTRDGYSTVPTEVLDDVAVAAAAGQTVTSVIADAWSALAAVRGCPDARSQSLMAGHLADQLQTVAAAARDLAAQHPTPAGDGQ
jgi:hypothetical protein